MNEVQRALGAVVMVLAVGCGGSSETTAAAPTPPALAAVIDAARMVHEGAEVHARVREGDRAPIDVTLDGRPLRPDESTTLTWSSSADAIARVEAGQLVGVAPGTAVLTGTVGASHGTLAVTVESALVGDWRDAVAVRRVRPMTDGTFEIFRVSRDEDAIMAGQSRGWRRGGCRSCLLDSMYALGSPYGSFRSTGPRQWEYRFDSTTVRCGGFAGCQPTTRPMIANVTLTPEGNLVLTSLADGVAPTIWTRVEK